MNKIHTYAIVCGGRSVWLSANCISHLCLCVTVAYLRHRTLVHVFCECFMNNYKYITLISVAIVCFVNRFNYLKPEKASPYNRSLPISIVFLRLKTKSMGKRPQAKHTHKSFPCRFDQVGWHIL